MKFLIRIKDIIVHSKLRTKIFAALVCIGIFPIIIFGSLMYNEASRILAENAEKNLYNILIKNNEIIEMKLSVIENETLSIITDNNVYNVFSKQLPDDDYELTLINYEVRQILNTYFSKYDYVYSSYLITTKMAFGQNANMFIPKDQFYESALYKTAYTSNGSMSWVPTYNFADMYNLEKYNSFNFDYKYTFSAIRLINSVYIDSGKMNEEGTVSVNHIAEDIERPILLILFKEDFLSDAFDNLETFEDAAYYVFDDTGSVVSSSNETLLATQLDEEWIQTVANLKNGSTYLTIEGVPTLVCFDRSKTTGWTSVVTMPYKTFLKTLPDYKIYMVVLALLIIALSIAVAFFISSKIAKPIKRMLIVMDKMSQGEFSNRIKYDKKNEIGMLYKHFNKLSDKIENLIEANYVARIRQKEAQVDALTAQINPHFITNTLSTINWMALDKKEETISQMLISLSSMMDYTIRNKKELVTLEEELRWLDHYIFIMSNRFMNTFLVEMDIDPFLYSTYVPKLFLQPLIENAITHGFEEIESGGLIKISGWIKDNRRYFTVIDNGKGINCHQIKDIFSRENQSIGIKNIDKRIKLLYGDPFGLEIESIENEYTRIIICMPL